MTALASSNFVTTIPLHTTPRDESILRKRFDAARSCYNALLGECLRRSRLMRESKAWHAAGKMPKGKEKSAAYKTINAHFQFREYDLYRFIQQQRKHPSIGLHLDTHTCQSLASRAFSAVQRSIFKGGKVRFSRASEFRSVEGASGKSPLRWQDGAIVWSKLKLTPMDVGGDAVIRHGLESKIGTARLVRMAIRGKMRYFAQLVCEGEAYKKQKHKPAVGVVGLDIGPSTIAIVSDQSATLERFGDELENKSQIIRRLQRQADRQQRTNNPHCFDAKGRWIKGQRIKVRSIRMKRVRQQAAEVMRQQQSQRKNLHGRLVHQVLSWGSDVRTEKLSYRSFQRNFGKSVGVRAPGMFVSRLKKEAEKWDGSTVTEFNPGPTLLSQTCPKCGTLRKKKLSERTHDCGCGCVVQRDIASAHLARYVLDGRLDTANAFKAWQGVCNLLCAVSSITNGSTNGALARVHLVPNQGREPSHANDHRNHVSVGDAVTVDETARAPEKRGDGDRHSLTDATKSTQREAASKVADPSLKIGVSRKCGDKSIG